MYLWFEGMLDRGRLPLLICFAAFVVTFVATRAITRMIKAGRGPFKNNVSASGVHVHHAVPGVILLVVGAFTALAVDLDSMWSIVAGLSVGIGTALVLDEFALIVHLDDVYWSDKGRISVEIVSLAVAGLGLVLLGANPLGFLDEKDQNVTVVGVLFTLTVHLVCIAVCVMKGKYRTALLGVFIPPLALIGAIRLALPGSRWARRWYSPKKLTRAEARVVKYGARWEPLMRWSGHDDVIEPADREAEPAPSAT